MAAVTILVALGATASAKAGTTVIPAAPSGSAPVVSSTPAAPAVPAPPAAGTVRGEIVSVDWSQLTVRYDARHMGVRQALHAAADTIAAGDYPYVWGGGHAAAGIASVGIKGGLGHNGKRVGFDCSGTVAAMLAGAGLWPAGEGVPSDAGVIAQLRRDHLIVRGRGSGPRQVTLWDDPGIHIFAQLGLTFFGTSDGGAPSPENPNGGAGWLDDGAPDTDSHHYHPWHFVASALRGVVSYGPTLTVALHGIDPYTEPGLATGDHVSVSYRTLHRALVASSVTPG